MTRIPPPTEGSSPSDTTPRTAGRPARARRVGVFGWGIVAPRSPDVLRFAANLATPDGWLSPFDGFGQSNFLVGAPELDFAAYQPWIERRFGPAKFGQLRRMGSPTQYAAGAFIQALSQNPALEEELRQLGPRAHVYLGTGVGDLATTYEASLALHRAQRRWNRFWADPARNRARREPLARPEDERRRETGAPPSPESAPESEREAAEDTFHAYWAARSPELADYLAELREIEALSVEGAVDTAKMAVLKEKRTRTARLQKKWNAPEPPWSAVPADLLWNIHNAPAAQISILGKITGMTFAPVGACASFGYALKLAMDAIDRGDARAVVVGMTDPAPHPLLVGGFYAARVLAAHGEVSKPLTGLRGTHIAGGAAVWIVGDYEWMTAKGFRPLGMEPIAVGVSADADHLITPSKDGPLVAIQEALEIAGIGPEEIGTWDLHATATPGDYTEVQTLRSLLPDSVQLTARKGVFGHGMSVCGGWELTAQYLGYERGVLFPTSLRREELNPTIGELHQRFVFDQPCPAPAAVAGKLLMGIGGINACVLSRPWA